MQISFYPPYSSQHFKNHHRKADAASYSIQVAFVRLLSRYKDELDIFETKLPEYDKFNKVFMLKLISFCRHKESIHGTRIPCTARKVLKASL